MRESRMYGSVRGAFGNGRPYRDRSLLVSEASRRAGRGSHPELGPRPALRRDGDHDMTQEQKIIRVKATEGRAERGIAKLPPTSMRTSLSIVACQVGVALSVQCFGVIFAAKDCTAIFPFRTTNVSVAS